MRVLLTNHTLAHRAGTELYVRDLALALLARGHQPIAYSRHQGEVGEELRRATVPVLDDLDKTLAAPDLIHGQHHLETMTALARFPGVPAIHVCHGWLPPEEAPPRHPRVLRHVAVNDLVKLRLTEECGIPSESVVTIRNWVDTERFRPRAPLPPAPRRALVFSNHLDETHGLGALREACAAAGIALDVAGLAAGRPVARPEEVLGGYDLVFAKGRSTLEAAAVGAAVIVCDVEGLGPMVSSGELARLESLNFGVRLMREPITATGVARELARYDPADAAEVSRRVRSDCGMAAAVDVYLALYEEVLAEHRARPLPGAEEEGRAMAAYLRRGPLAGAEVSLAERERLRAEAASLRGELSWMRATATWRWRERLTGRRWLVRFYRVLFRRRSPC